MAFGGNRQRISGPISPMGPSIGGFTPAQQVIDPQQSAIRQRSSEALMEAIRAGSEDLSKKRAQEAQMAHESGMEQMKQSGENSRQMTGLLAGLGSQFMQQRHASKESAAQRELDERLAGLRESGLDRRWAAELQARKDSQSQTEAFSREVRKDLQARMDAQRALEGLTSGMPDDYEGLLAPYSAAYEHLKQAEIEALQLGMGLYLDQLYGGDLRSKMFGMTPTSDLMRAGGMKEGMGASSPARIMDDYMRESGSFQSAGQQPSSAVMKGFRAFKDSMDQMVQLKDQTDQLRQSVPVMMVFGQDADLSQGLKGVAVRMMGMQGVTPVVSLGEMLNQMVTVFGGKQPPESVEKVAIQPQMAYQVSSWLTDAKAALYNQYDILENTPSLIPPEERETRKNQIMGVVRQIDRIQGNYRKVMGQVEHRMSMVPAYQEGEWGDRLTSGDYPTMREAVQEIQAQKNRLASLIDGVPMDQVQEVVQTARSDEIRKIQQANIRTSMLMSEGRYEEAMQFISQTLDEISASRQQRTREVRKMLPTYKDVQGARRPGSRLALPAADEPMGPTVE